MILSCSLPASGATIYAFVKKLSNGTYYHPGLNQFAVWGGVAAHRIALAEEANLSGTYSATFTLNTTWTDGEYLVAYYSNSVASTALISSKVFSVVAQAVASSSGMVDMIQRVAGLSKENMFLTDVAYDTDGRMTGGTIQLFSSFPFDPAVDLPIATYRVVQTFTSGLMRTFKCERQT